MAQKPKKKTPEQEAAGNIGRTFGYITKGIDAAQRALGVKPEDKGPVQLAPKLRKKIREMGK